MSENQEIDKRIEETLNSLDGMRRAEANPFLFTRIQARISQSRSGLERIVSLAGKPAFAFLVLVIVLVTNLTVVLQGSSESTAVKQDQSQLAVADEYDLDVPSLYDYENPEP
jgi:hypothetical protein